jgi:hypothetical protein
MTKFHNTDVLVNHAVINAKTIVPKVSFNAMGPNLAA